MARTQSSISHNERGGSRPKGPGLARARPNPAHAVRPDTRFDAALTNVEAIAAEVKANRLSTSRVLPLLDDLSERLCDLREAADLQREQLRTQSDFLAEVSHDVRTPMTSVLGFTQLLLDTELTQEQRRWLDIVASRGRVLMELVEGILDLSKLEAGKLQFATTPSELRPLLGGVVESLEIQAQGKPLQLRLELAPDVPAVVVCDPLRLQQVLQNLLANALKFTSQGQVMLRVRAVEVPSSDDPRQLLHFEVRDTGEGIPSDRLACIFEPFVRGTQNQESGGAGLGLAIAKRLVEAMGGAIWVESVPGAGTAFHFTLLLASAPSPLPDHAPPSAALPSAPAAAHNELATPLRVLVAEDDAASRTLLSILLQRSGHDVVTVANGREAYEAFRETPFDLVLMDVQMPLLNGYRAARLIRRYEEGNSRQTPIVALTAHAMGAEARRCRAAGMNSRLAKPIDRDALQAVLTAIRQGDRLPAECRNACDN